MSLSGTLEMPVPTECAPILCAKFLENSMKVLFNGSGAQSELARDVLIRQTTSNQKRHFALARGQHFVPRIASCHADGANQSIHSKSRTPVEFQSNSHAKGLDPGIKRFGRQSVPCINPDDDGHISSDITRSASMGRTLRSASMAEFIAARR
jgi:hypothetical protein